MHMGRDGVNNMWNKHNESSKFFSLSKALQWPEKLLSSHWAT